LKQLRDQLKENKLKKHQKPKSSSRKPKTKVKPIKNSPSPFEHNAKTLGYDPWAPRTRSKDKIDWDKYGLSPEPNPKNRSKKKDKTPKNDDGNWDNTLGKGHLLPEGPPPLEILPKQYKRRKEVDPRSYKDGASYKIPIFERRAYDVESPVKAYINSPSPQRKPRKDPNDDKSKKRGLSPTSKYYLGLSQRRASENKDPEMIKSGFVLTETLKRTLKSAQPESDSEMDEPIHNQEFTQINHIPEGQSVDDHLRVLLMDALKSKLSIIEGNEEYVANLTRQEIEHIVWSEQQ
jgi:hypothetical protein